MECMVLKSFPFSRDGVTTLQARAGETVDIPDDLVPGLTGEGYVKAADGMIDHKAFDRAPEVQAFEAAPENKVATYEARETGRGWFAIFKDGVEVEALKKVRHEEASAFNAMTDEEKAAHVAAELAERS